MIGCVYRDSIHVMEDPVFSSTHSSSGGLELVGVSVFGSTPFCLEELREALIAALNSSSSAVML